ncbi:MAG: NADAR family protein [Clostridiales bacterium]|nr:NADAR family protein [Clostridiales bacterium]
MKVIGFHNPDEENGFLGNWYLSEFTVDGIVFTSMEQFMMYKKAVCFNNREIAKQILETNDVACIKKLGRLVSGYNDSVWNGIRQIVVYEGLIAKFSQNDELQKKLKDTKDAILAECAVQDRIWGIGLSMNDSKRQYLEQWRGQNLLGYTLMMVRDRL